MDLSLIFTAGSMIFLGWSLMEKYKDDKHTLLLIAITFALMAIYYKLPTL